MYSPVLSSAYQMLFVQGIQMLEITQHSTEYRLDHSTTPKNDCATFYKALQ